ncbi:MAG: terminase small subunit [archaeon]|nr:terminase small subunit [archaeon]
MRELNERQTKFCEEYVANGFNGTQAYKLAYEEDGKIPGDNVAAVEAHRMLRDGRFVDKIKDIEGNYRIAGHKAGINKQAIMNALARMLDATKTIYYTGNVIGEENDFIAVNNAITTYAKLTGDFAPEKKDVKIEESGNIDITKLTVEEREAYKTKILAEL